MSKNGGPQNGVLLLVSPHTPPIAGMQDGYGSNLLGLQVLVHVSNYRWGKLLFGVTVSIFDNHTQMGVLFVRAA